MKREKGMVLFFSLIVLVLMTVIGVALAVNSGQSLRMAGAGSERVEAKAVAHGGQARAVEANEGAIMANMTDDLKQTVTIGTSPVENTLSPMTAGDVNCQRSTKANSANLISCRRIEIESLVKFGRKNMGELTVVAGVEQEVLTGSGG